MISHNGYRWNDVTRYLMICWGCGNAMIWIPFKDWHCPVCNSSRMGKIWSSYYGEQGVLLVCDEELL